ncbi:uncharacterized protein LOC128852854 isoform X2 [Cuculus canorus]|uniref:uncharacterized protein LOC128852854 isoform X2 n=1 Tax=Cuculus canorus TaxID=55661 RepID=UPI0023AAA904|nr:uncharacterized protein LOC128852854 isoform X2 [Cuculus canorus]
MGQLAPVRPLSLQGKQSAGSNSTTISPRQVVSRLQLSQHLPRVRESQLQLNHQLSKLLVGSSSANISPRQVVISSSTTISPRQAVSWLQLNHRLSKASGEFAPAQPAPLQSEGSVGFNSTTVSPRRAVSWLQLNLRLSRVRGQSAPAQLLPLQGERSVGSSSTTIYPRARSQSAPAQPPSLQGNQPVRSSLTTISPGQAASQLQLDHHLPKFLPPAYFAAQNSSPGKHSCSQHAKTAAARSNVSHS